MRDLILPISNTTANPRPMHAEKRAKYIRTIALGRKRLGELIKCKTANINAVSACEGRSARSVHMTISLVFVAPDIVEAAIVGRLPCGIGITRLVDLSPSWTKQKELLGLPTSF